MKKLLLLLCFAAGYLHRGDAQSSFSDSLRNATSRVEQQRWNLFRNEFC